MISGTTLAQTSLVVPDLSVPTKIAPAYFGWEKDGDAPMTLKTSICGNLGNIDIILGHQAGLAD